jgi:hypothetical protein
MVRRLRRVFAITCGFYCRTRPENREDRDDPMPQGPTDNLFLAAGGFGFVAALVGVGLIVAASLGFLR